MDSVKKFEIDISTPEKKEKVLELFKTFNKICDIYAFFGVKDTPKNNRYVHEIGDRIGFDFSYYKEKKKKYCLYCGKELKRGQKKFCCNSCAATYNNKGKKHSEETKLKIAKTLSKTGNIIKKEKYCLYCGKELKSGQHQYCSIKCFQNFYHEKRLKEWKNNPEKFSSESIPSVIKKFLLEKYNYKCQKCGWGKKNEVTGKIPLEIHHIDGDCTNNKEENLELLCPNCHSLTPNHGSLNKMSKRYKFKKYRDLIK